MENIWQKTKTDGVVCSGSDSSSTGKAGAEPAAAEPFSLCNPNAQPQFHDARV